VPGETDDDIAAIIDLAHQVRRLGARIGGRKTEVHVSVSTFVPKPHTTFQWEPLADAETIERRQAMLQRSLRGRGLRLSWNQYDGTRLEALLARGDRHLNAVVEAAWRHGARFDAWDEWHVPEAWTRAISETGIDAAFYLYRRRTPEEVLPWDHLQSGVEKRFFAQDYKRSQNGELLADCRAGCHACGILRNHSALWTDEWQCPNRNHES